MTRKLVLTALGAWMLSSASAGEIVLEAEAFRDRGGWVVDSQSMDQVGSPFLLAHGLGRSVANAKTEFMLDKAGTWHLSVRTRNWTAPWSKSAAGLFRVRIDGKAVPGTFGDGSGEWHWRTVAVELAAGAHELELEDMTGFDGRCDLVVLRDEPGEPDLAKIRAAEKASAKTAVIDCDLAVVGGGVAGVCAAVTAARKGLKVALVNDREVLGGNNSSEIRVHLGGAANTGRYPRLGDVLGEISPAYFGNAREASGYGDANKLAVVAAETNVTLVLGCRVNGVEKKGARIALCTGVSVTDGTRTTFRARWFVDATGDGALGALAGADFRMGREGRDEFGEPSAPERGDRLMMGASVQWYAEKGEGEFPRRAWMLPFDDSNCYPLTRGDWDWETGLDRDTATDIERVRDYGMLVAYSNWAFVKSASTNRAAFADRALAWVSHVAGKRESRRLVGDYFVTEKDVVDHVVQDDGTCESTWTIDLHYPKSQEELKFAGESFRATSVQRKILPYPIPYRALYSRNVPNLFMAGRDISVSHIALGTTRVMRTTGMMGEVVGLAAAVCARRRCDPRIVYEDYLDELKAEMAKGAGRKGFVASNQGYNQGDSLDKNLRKKSIRSLELASPESQGVSSDAIRRWLDRVERDVDAIHSFVLVRHGKVIAEGDWAPYESLSVPHALYSHSKSYTSTAIGLLCDEGKLNLNERVSDILTEEMPTNACANLRELRVRDLLTMTCGGWQPHAIWGRPEIRDWTRCFLAKPMPEKPGLRFCYDSDATYLLAEIVERKSGEKMMDYLGRKLFVPLGMDSIRTNVSPDGTPCAGWGMFASTRDNAKFGQLYLNEGELFGRRLISKDWVRMATARQADASVMGWGQDAAGYGFQFWRCCIPGVYRADGMLGQLTVVDPERDFVLSIHAGSHSYILQTVWDVLLPAFGKEELPHDAAALAALRERCDKLSLKCPEGGLDAAADTKLMGEWKVEGDAFGMTRVRLAAQSGGWLFAYEDGLGWHELAAGCGEWRRGELRLYKEDEVDFISVLPGLNPAATAAAWKDGAFTLRTYFVNAPVRLNFKFAPKPDGTVTLVNERMQPDVAKKAVTLRR